MTPHVSISRMERFCLSGLPEAELAVITDHLVQCQPCHELFADTLGKRRGPASVKFTLEPEYWFKHEHVDFEQLVDLAEGKLDATDREILDIHLSGCDGCREDVRSFLAFRTEMEPDLRVRYGPATRKPQHQEVQRWSWLRAFPRKPAYAAVLVILGIAIVVAIIVMKRSAVNFEARERPIQNRNVATLPTPSPKERAAQKNPSPQVPSNVPPIPNPSPILTVKNRPPVRTAKKISGAIALYDDHGRTVTIDQAGTVSGLDDVVPETRNEIAKALTEKIEAPEILTRLSGTEIILRGPNSGQLVKLRSPARTVVIADRPSFEWDKLPGATSYRVYVGDLKGREVAKSDELSAAQTMWRPAGPLKRGEIYSWAVAAVVDGKEVLSPGAAAPEMKFQVLSGSDLQKLYQLKMTRSHLVLGVFYVKAGLLTEGERELRELVHLNPADEAPKRLLRSVQLMRGTPP